MKPLIFVFALLPLFFSSCKKEKQNTIVSNPHWIEDSTVVLGAKFIENACSDGVYIYFQGGNYYGSIDTNGNVYLAQGYSSTFSQKLAISPQFTMFTDFNLPGYFEIWNNKTQQDAFKWLPLNQVDSLFQGFYPPFAPQLQTYGAFNTTADQLLLPGVPGNDSAGMAVFYLAEFRYWNTRSLKKITVHVAPWTTQNLVYSFNGSYFIATGEGEIYKMDTMGNCQLVYANGGDGYNDMFAYQGKLYASSNNAFYVSQDLNGEQWTAAYQVSGLAGAFNFYTINNRLVCTSNDQVYELVFNSGGFVTHQLVNRGLAGNLITSVQPIGKRIYATTLSGLFWTQVDSFFVYR